jgi:hypothetical protein
MLGTSSQNAVEATSHAGTSASKPASCNRAAETTKAAIAAATRKTKSANSPWPAKDPTLIFQARA